MNITYFNDTDTAHIQFTDARVAETRDLAEDVLVDLDASGNLVALTIEHARDRARLPEVHFEESMAG
jgi:uncharacterized protein YuzE